MAGVAVDDPAVEVDLGQEERHELGGETASVDDLVEARNGARQLVLPGQAHPQTGEDVAHLEGRRQTVAGGVGHHHVKDVCRRG